MTKARRSEGPCAPLFYLAAALLITASGNAGAQTVEQSDLELCTSLETAELKLACFEALTAIEGRGAKSAADAAPKPLPESAATEKALVTAGAAAGVPGSDAGRVAPAPAPVADDDQADVADNLGRERLDEEKVVKQEKPVIVATVTNVVKGNYDVLYFHFKNGQVWRQIEGRHFGYRRDGEFEVIINTGMMGDYRLRHEEGGPMTRIRRVQ